MNYFALTSLVNGVVSTICGIVVFIKDPHSNKNRIYGLYCLSLSIWAYSYVLWQMATNPGDALFYCRLFMMGAIWIPVFHYHHILSMFGLKGIKRRRFLIYGYISSCIYFISNFSNLFIKGIEPRNIFHYWPIPGVLFHIYLIGFGIFVVSAIVLIREYREKAPPIIRNQIDWAMIATMVGYGGGATNFLLWYNIPILPYLNIFVSLVVGITALLFFRLGNLNLHIFLRDTTVHLLSSAVIGLLIGFVFYLLTMSWLIFFLVLGYSVLNPIIYKNTYKVLRSGINRTKLGRVDKYLDSLGNSIAQIRESTFTYDDLAKNIVHAVLKTFSAEMAAVYILDKDSNKLWLRFQTGMHTPEANDLVMNRDALSINLEDPLVNFLRQDDTVLIREEIGIFSKLKKNIYADIERTLARLEAEACVPFIVLNNIKGILVLGKKSNGTMFHEEDKNAINSFGKMAEEILRYIIGMEHEVLNTGFYSHDMNNDAKSLRQVIQFLLNPLSNEISSEKRRSLLEKCEDVTARLDQSFSLQRDRSQLILKSIKGEYDKKPCDITSLANKSIDKYNLRAEELKLKFSFRPLNEKILINGNENDIIRVIDNLINNAFRYISENGLIIIEMTRDANDVFLKISDDGEGIEQDDLDKIWNFGWQSKDKKHGASGFGLSIVKQIVALHGGSITVHSDGKGKGTSFTVSFPILNFNEFSAE